MSHELCDALCVGFEYFAVQTGYRCYCGQSYGTQGNVSQPSWCNQKCTGDKSQVCGGNCRGFHSASSVYKRNQQAGLQPRQESQSAAPAAARPDNGGDLQQQGEGQARLRDSGSHCHLFPSCQAPNASVDWTTEGVVVADVSDQGSNCNASWAFAAAAAVESAAALSSGRLLPLSPQHIIDCAWQFGGQSCKGGDVTRGLMFAQNVGLCEEETYPFTATNADCCRSNCRVAVPGQEDGGVQGFCNVPPASESALMSVLNLQPVAVGLALPDGFLETYKGGVYMGDAPRESLMNEAALAVGYGSRGGQQYWKVKLFRGKSFGEEGFVLLARGASTGKLGQCSILSAPSCKCSRSLCAPFRASKSLVCRPGGFAARSGKTLSETEEAAALRQAALLTVRAGGAGAGA
jgi:hypothetical protein